MNENEGCVVCGQIEKPEYRAERVVSAGDMLETVYVCASPECFTGFDEVLEVLNEQF